MERPVVVGDHFLVQGVDLSIILHIVGPAFFFLLLQGGPEKCSAHGGSLT